MLFYAALKVTQVPRCWDQAIFVSTATTTELITLPLAHVHGVPYSTKFLLDKNFAQYSYFVLAQNFAEFNFAHSASCSPGSSGWSS